MRNRSKSVSLDEGPSKVYLDSLANAFEPEVLVMLGDAFEDVFSYSLIRQKGGQIGFVPQNMNFFEVIDRYVPRLCKKKFSEVPPLKAKARSSTKWQEIFSMFPASLKKIFVCGHELNCYFPTKAAREEERSC